MNDSTDSTDAGTAAEATTGELDGAQGDQIDGDDSAGDAVSGATSDEDGVPTPTGSIPPGPATLENDDTTDAAALPPLKERMY